MPASYTAIPNDGNASSGDGHPKSIRLPPNDPYQEHAGETLWHQSRSSIVVPGTENGMNDVEPGSTSTSNGAITPTETDPIREPQGTDALKPRFAKVELFSRFLPAADPKRSTFKTKRSERKNLLLGCFAIAVFVLLVNLGSTIVFVTKWGSQNGIGTIFKGDCQHGRRLSTWMHLLINILSTLLLWASNLCMQLLAAPTRLEVDKAHEKSIWLDIGVPSMRNLRHIARWRGLVWSILGLSSIPLHFLYNSAILPTVAHNSVNWAVVTPNFAYGANWDINNTLTTLLDMENKTIPALKDQYTGNYTIVNRPLSDSIQGKWGVKPGSGRISELDAQPVQEMLSALQTDAASGRLVKVGKLSCLLDYTDPVGNRSDVLLVSSSVYGNSNSLLWWGQNVGAGVYVNPGGWLCQASNTFSCKKLAIGHFAGRNATVKSAERLKAIEDWNVGGYKIDYCLEAQRSTEDKCGVEYSLFIVIAVCIANLLKCICIALTYAVFVSSQKKVEQEEKKKKAEHEEKREMKQEEQKKAEQEAEKEMEQGDKIPSKAARGKHLHLYILGDAQASFLEDPDSTTVGMSTTARIDLLGKKKDWASQVNREAREWIRQPMRWSSALSTRRFAGTIILLSTNFLFGTGFMIAAIVGMNSPDSAFPKGARDIFSLGFGRSNESIKLFLMFLPSQTGMKALFTNVFFANYWQFVVSFQYLFFTAFLSCMLNSDEWAGYYHDRKALRVSVPRGLQRSSYFVSMPFKYGMPSLIAFAILHWTLSQSIFVVRITAFFSNGEQDYSSSISTAGTSPLAVLVSQVVWVTIIIALITLARLRRFSGDMPLASTCSAAISAACHPHKDDNEAFSFPVVWKDVSEAEDGIGHFSFTTRADDDDKEPKTIKKYMSFVAAPKPITSEQVMAESNVWLRRSSI